MPITGAACRARSTADIIAKLKIAEEESDETAYWLELLIESGTMTKRRLANLLQESDEITAMIVASIKTLRTRLNAPQPRPNRQS